MGGRRRRHGWRDCPQASDVPGAAFVIADLSNERPNVYLEVGYAWGLERPVILIAKDGHKLHFDLSHHRCLFYKNITRLAESLEREIRKLFVPREPGS